MRSEQIAAGVVGTLGSHTRQWRDTIVDIAPGGVLIAYLKDHGFVGIGRVKRGARPYSEFRIGRKFLHDLGLKEPGMSARAADPENCEYLIEVEWVKAFPRAKARWKPHAGLFTTQLVRATLDNQPKTIEFVEREFKVDPRDLVR